MCILIHSGFVAEPKQHTSQSDEVEKGYVLTLAGRLLLKDSEMSSRPFLLGALDPVLMKPWQSFGAWFQNGDANPSAFATSHGKPFWDYAEYEPRINHLFNEAMAGVSLLIAKVMITKCKGFFKGLKSLVDVGGGTGTITKILANIFPEMDCTVFDLPHVVAGLQGEGNLKYIGGNMLDKVPFGDAVMLKVNFALYCCCVNQFLGI
ncbi:O-methyltransferase, family 2 [Corchorus capsularis]|uniref:O-methyltransferase, family 2 n=1 Tax=Corchorus capsularis TaxID=210143 RepID=A0A1R3KZA2_COCAP|nr:O-methyltransferase, family 2 [Corchorus capsularis]